MIYFDHAATTGLEPEALEAMLPYLTEYYGNAGSVHTLGTQSRAALHRARRILAESIGASPEEIVFTSGGTESDRIAILGACELCGGKKHIITSSVEHPAVLGACKSLAKRGYEITYLPVDANGSVHPSDLEWAIRPDTALISVMYANNEVGTISDIAQLAAVAKRHGVLFHTDAVQAYGHLPIHVKQDGVDFLSASAHKFGGPKGVGFLYVRSGIFLREYLEGGGQEQGRRSGTENVPGIVGMAKAAELAHQKLDRRTERLLELECYLREALIRRIPTVSFLGDEQHHLPGLVSVCFAGKEAEELLIALDRCGICVSGGSACSARERRPSHVLTAMGRSAEQIRGTLRISLGYENTIEEIDFLIEKLISL